MNKGDIITLICGMIGIFGSAIFYLLNNGILALLCWIPILIIWGLSLYKIM